jgi:hypothetical protein
MKNTLGYYSSELITAVKVLKYRDLYFIFYVVIVS